MTTRTRIPSPLVAKENRTEAAAAKRFIDERGEVVRWCDPWGKWLVWDGARWKIDNECRIEALAKETSDAIWDEIGELLPELERQSAAELCSFGRAMSSARGISAMLSLARSKEGIPILPDQLDKDPWLLNLQNGTLDLRTGLKRDHAKEDLITKLAPVTFCPCACPGAVCPTDPSACPIWDGFLLRIMPDQPTRGFLRRLVGYWITGSVRDHILPIFHGIGANGKSVFLNTIMAMLGPDYACHAAPDLLLSQKDTHPTERADLHGRRLVCAVETGDGRRLNEPLVKMLTGGERVKGRRMKEDFWEFDASHKFCIGTNNRPNVRGTDWGIWRRLLLVMFGVVIPPEEQDKTLPEKLIAEFPGILNWAIVGCLEWQQHGLNPPASVQAATEEYKRDEDTFQRYLDARTIKNSGISVGATALYKDYFNWCDENGETPIKQTAFGRRLNDLGFHADRGGIGGRVVRHGIGLLDSSREGFE